MKPMPSFMFFMSTENHSTTEPHHALLYHTKNKVLLQLLDQWMWEASDTYLMIKNNKKHDTPTVMNPVTSTNVFPAAL